MGFVKFLMKRAATLTIMIFVALYLTVIVVNYAGWWDNVQRDYIQRQVYMDLQGITESVSISAFPRWAS